MLNVLFAASECVPFIKTGGLADVIGSLPKELHGLGLDVRVILPKYKWIDMERYGPFELVVELTIKVGWRNQYCGVQKVVYEGITYYFIDNEFYFGRDGIYGLHDDAERFAFFNKAVLAVLPRIGFCPNVLHLHDWQTGMMSLLLKAQYSHDPFYTQMKTVFTIHNLQYQGVFPKSVLSDLFDLSSAYFHPQGVEFYNNVNYLKAGLVYSGAITTVSETYANEIQVPFYGEELDGLLQSRSSDLYGIVNGIDYDTYNPDGDPHIYKFYSEKRLRNKVDNKLRLQRQLGLPEDRKVPMIAMITRLTNQKGLDLVERVLTDIVAQDVQFVLLGTGDRKYEEMFAQAAWHFPDRVSANILFDNTLAHRIYAAADLFLMPSRFEPCGLSQLIAMRYGCLPIVRETGGLKDTVIPYNEETKTGYGFSFTNYNAHDMLYTINRALEFYRNKPIWNQLRKSAMKQDFSWHNSAKRYLELYKKLLTPARSKEHE